jgi:hypothetical protein
MADIIRTGIAAARAADPTAEVLAYMGHICGWDAAWYQDEYTLDPYTYLTQLDRSGVNLDGIALQLTYGSVNEWGGATEIEVNGFQSPYFFRDLASISRLLDWYGTLSKPIHITEFNVPGNFESNLGYWHNRSWDETLKTEWIKRFYTIAFSKPLLKEITYWSAIDQPYMRANRGLLDSHHSPRESYYALKSLITGNWTTHLTLNTDANGQVSFRGFAGNYTIMINTKNSPINSTIHVSEQTSQAYTIKIGQPSTHVAGMVEAEQAIANATEAVNKAKTEGRTILLDKAESLLQDAERALAEENYTQAILSAQEASQAAESAVTWLVMPAVVAFAGVIVSVAMLLRKRGKKDKI